MEIVNSLVLITLHVLISQVYNRISIFSLLSTHVISFNIIINTKSNYMLYYNICDYVLYLFKQISLSS